jgi:hypothetical protein
VQRLKPHRQCVNDTLFTQLAPLGVANSEHYAPSGARRGGEATFKSLAYDFFRFVSTPRVEPKRSKGLSTALQRKGFKAGRQSLEGKQVRGFSGLKLDR